MLKKRQKNTYRRGPVGKGVKNEKIVQITETVSIPVNILAAIPKENLPKVFWKISPKPTKTGIRTISEKRI